MDTAQTTKDVVLQLKGKVDPSVTTSLEQVGKAADKAQKPVAGIGKGLRDLRMADRSLMGLGHGFMMMGMMAGGANAKLQNTFSVLMGFHAAVQVFRGLAVAIDMTSRSLDGFARKGVASNLVARELKSGVLPALAAPKGSGTDFVVGGMETAASRALLSTMKHPLAAAVVTIVASTVILGSKGSADWAGEAAARLPERNSGWGGALRFLPNIGIQAANYWFADVLGMGKRVPLLGEGGKPGPFEKQELRERAHQRQLEAFQVNLQNVGIEAPFRERVRALGGVQAQTRAQADLLGIFGQDFVRREARTGTRALQGLLEQGLGVDRGPGLQKLLEGAGGVHFLEQREKAVDLARTMAEHKAAASTKTVLAEREFGRAATHRDTLAGQMRAFEANKQAMIANGAQPNLAEQKRLEDELAAATQRTFEAQQKYNDALRAGQQVSRDNLKTFKSFAEENQKHYRSIRQQEEEKRKDLFQQYGLMNPAEKQATMNLAQKLAGGPAAGGRGPRWRVGAGGKMVFDPGTVGNLTQQELQMARSNPFLGELLKDYSKKLGGKDQEGFEKLMKLSGLDVKRQQAAQAEKFFADVRVHMENKINAEIKINEGDLAKQLQKLIPDILKAQQQAEQAMQAELARQQMVRRGAQPK